MFDPFDQQDDTVLPAPRPTPRKAMSPPPPAAGRRPLIPKTRMLDYRPDQGPIDDAFREWAEGGLRES